MPVSLAIPAILLVSGLRPAPVAILTFASISIIGVLVFVLPRTDNPSAWDELEPS